MTVGVPLRNRDSYGADCRVTESSMYFFGGSLLSARDEGHDLRPLVSGYKSSRLSWLENEPDFSWDSDSPQACKMRGFLEEERLDGQVLFDPLEEELDPPAGLI